MFIISLHTIKPQTLPTDNKDKNKWCYTKDLNKLFLCPMISVPVDVTIDPWVDASVRITPVYIQPQFLREPVVKCFNCKTTRGCDAKCIEHIVQLDNDHSVYEELPDNRYAARVPLMRAPPGDRSSTILIKFTCMTSCVGGPNRRPFCLVLSLLCNSTGREIGRQILDVKCCKSTNRDMNKELDHHKAKNRTQFVEQVEKIQAIEKVGDLAKQIKVSRKRKRPNHEVSLQTVTREDPETDDRFVNIAVPVELEREVKKLVNCL